MNSTVANLVVATLLSGPLFAVPMARSPLSFSISGCRSSNFVYPFWFSRACDLLLTESIFRRFQSSALIIEGEEPKTCERRTVEGGPVTISECLFEDIDSGESGGAIRSTASRDVNVTDSAFVKCTSKGNGGAIYVDQNWGVTSGGVYDVDITSCRFEDCFAERYDGGDSVKEVFVGHVIVAHRISGIMAVDETSVKVSGTGNGVEGKLVCLMAWTSNCNVLNMSGSCEKVSSGLCAMTAKQGDIEYKRVRCEGMSVSHGIALYGEKDEVTYLVTGCDVVNSTVGSACFWIGKVLDSDWLQKDMTVSSCTAFDIIPGSDGVTFAGKEDLGYLHVACNECGTDVMAFAEQEGVEYVPPATDIFTESIAFTASSHFTESTLFSASAQFTESTLFSASAQFTESTLFSASVQFTESTLFTASDYFTESIAGTETAMFTETASFTGTDDWVTSRPETLSEGGVDQPTSTEESSTGSDNGVFIIVGAVAAVIIVIIVIIVVVIVVVLRRRGHPQDVEEKCETETPVVGSSEMFGRGSHGLFLSSLPQSLSFGLEMSDEAGDDPFS